MHNDVQNDSTWEIERLEKRVKERSQRFAHLAAKYAESLSKSKSEEDVYKFLRDNPESTLEALNDGSKPLDLVSKFPLGTEFVTDFVILGVWSFGIPYHCVFVELESPVSKQFTKAGVYSAKLNQAIRQVTEWQHWLKTHFDEFCLSLPSKLMKYKEDPNLAINLRSAYLTFKIVIGRRSYLTTKNRESISSFFDLHHGSIEIVTYDRILDRLRFVAGEREAPNLL